MEEIELEKNGIAKSALSTFRKFMIAATAAWTLAMGGSFTYDTIRHNENFNDLLHIAGRMAFENQVINRRWNANHGSVYVPITKETPSNEYLDVPERDITTPSGKKLTKVNPAYMTRQIFELVEKSAEKVEYAMRGKITSLKPIRPANAPNEWEANALQAFEEGRREASDIVNVNGMKYFRFMKPLITEKTCLKCHYKQGYKEGDVRGGIRVDVPLKLFGTYREKEITNSALGHLFLWLLGLGTGFIGYKKVKTGIDEKDVAVKRYRTLFDSSGDAIFISNLKGRFLDVNDVACERLGYSKEELLHMGAQDINTERIAAKVTGNIEKLHMEKNNEMIIEGEHVRKDGSIIPVEVNLRSIEYGGEPANLASARDITERTKTDEKLKKSEYELRERVKELTGIYSLNQSASLPLDELFTVFTNDIVPPSMQFPEKTFTHLTIDGRSYCNVSYATISDNALSSPIIIDGKTRGSLTIGYIDKGLPFIENFEHKLVEGYTNRLSAILEKREAYKKLKEAKMKAETADRLKSAFLANMSHEIRTPLNGINGFIDMVLDDNLTDEQRDNLRTARESGDLLLNLINDILDLSKVEAGQVKIEKIPCSLHKLLDSVGSTAQAILSPKGKNVDLRKNYPKNISRTIEADPTRIKQVMYNLLSNAVKFTTEGYVEYGVSLKGQDRIEFYVKDTGIGIADEKHDKIFNIFEQADMSTTRKYGGTGLGLSITKKLVSLMGDELKIESKLGEGSYFYFSIPYKPIKSAPESEKPDTIEKKGEEKSRSYRILVADDNPVNRKLAGKILEKSGYDVVTANDGKEAILRYKSDSIDLILMDVQMPYLNGLEATKLIRGIEKNEGGERVPILALTAAAMAEDMDKCLDAGCNNYLTKPINKETLVDVIKEYLS